MKYRKLKMDQNWWDKFLESEKTALTRPRSVKQRTV